MDWNDHIRLWNQAAVKLLDVRHTILKPGEEAKGYRMPASGYLLAVRGGARVILDGTVYVSKRFQLVHGGKGMCLDILLTEEEFEYYLIFYKAMLTMPVDRETRKMMENGSPFLVQYGFEPQEPIDLYEKIRFMEEQWNRSGKLEQFQAKGWFYLFVHELLRQLGARNVAVVRPNPVDRAIRYMNEHYGEAITAQAIAQMENCSVRNFTRLFRAQTGISPIDYLIRLRIGKAAELLLHTGATLQEIAAAVGYPDEYYFSRIFKKYAGLSPVQYKLRVNERTAWPHNPSGLSDLSIVPPGIRRYIGNENYYQYKGEGDSTMYSGSKPSLAAVMLLCFTLLLSACGTGTTNETAGNGGPQGQTNSDAGQQTPAAKQQKEAAAETRVYTNPDGKEVVIPVHPKRIASDQFFGAMIELGVKPVGLGDDYFALSYPLVKDYSSGIADLGSPTNFEKVAEVAPDLIVLATNNNYEQWARIAPTIVADMDPKFYDVREDMRFFGDILGMQAEAEAWIANFDAQVEEAKQAIPGIIAPDETVSVLRLIGKQPRVYTDRLAAGILYNEFQLKPTEAARQLMEKNTGLANISTEVLDQYAGDYIFLAVDPGSDSQDAARSILDSPLWTNLPAVKNNRVYSLDMETFLGANPLQYRQQIDLLVNMITSTKQ